MHTLYMCDSLGLAAPGLLVPLNVYSFSRSYCYTAWSAIGVIMLSVCLSVTLCTVHCSSHGRRTSLKVVPACS